MKSVQFTIEKCDKTNLFVGVIPEFAGAHTQAESIESLLQNLKEVCELLKLTEIQLLGHFNETSYEVQV